MQLTTKWIVLFSLLIFGECQDIDPRDLRYGFFTQEKTKIVMPYRAFVRLGILPRKWSYSTIQERGTEFDCRLHNFNFNDPAKGKTKTCYISEPVPSNQRPPMTVNVTNFEYVPFTQGRTNRTIPYTSVLRYGVPPDGPWAYSDVQGEGTNFWCFLYNFYLEDPAFEVLKSCEISVRGEITANPTSSPTSGPTASPTTGQPTSSPTQKPTASPTTGQPTSSPTQKPTASPTTAQPTSSPTQKTTAPQTLAPSASPTTSGPSSSPTTQSPSLSPTRQPSSSPTINRIAFCGALMNATDCSRVNFCTWSDSGESCFATGKKTPAPTTGGISVITVIAANLGLIGVVLCLLALGFIHYHRDKPVIQLSQAFFLKLLCVGALLVNTSVFPAAFEPTESWLCYLRKWWFEITLSFTLSIMFVRVWRVWRVFHGKTETAKGMTDSYLLRRVAQLVGIDAVLLTVWSVVGSPTVEYDDDKEGMVCVCESTWTVVLTYLYLGALVVLTAIFAFRVMHLGSVLGETKQIWIIINNIIVFAIFNVLIYFVGTEEHRVLTFAVTIFWCTLFSLFVLLWAKYEKFSLTRQDILLDATAKKKGSLNASTHVSRESTFRTGASGFATAEELKTVSANAVRFQQPAETGAGGSPLGSNSSTNSGSFRAATDHVQPVQMPQWNASATENSAPLNSGSSVGSAAPPLHSGSSFAELTTSYPTIDTEEKEPSNQRNGRLKRQLTESAMADGFKIGENGLWDEYVHRETGEGFWVHKETGEFSNTGPKTDVQLA